MLLHAAKIEYYRTMQVMYPVTVSC